MSRSRTWIAFGCMLIAVTVVYTSRLGDSPIYLMHDEVNFALQAHSIAASGRDTNGRLLPVYFSEAGFEAGRDPMVIYATALMLKLRPLSEAAVRMPTALVGVLSVALMFLLFRNPFSGVALQPVAVAVVAAILLALTPAHFVNSRLALSITYPIPFILAWLLCLDRLLTDGDRRLGWATGAILGLGIYTYVASLILMPIYLAITLLALVRDRRVAAVWPVVIGFLIALLPLVMWEYAHPGRYGNLLSVYRLSDSLGGDAARGRLAAFWMGFNPDFLFISGDARLTNSTRTSGMFPLACAIFIPVGLRSLWRGRAATFNRVLLLGFLTAPLASVASGRLEINRLMYLIPFGVLIAVQGVTALWTSPHRSTRMITIALLASIPLQFGFLYSHYLGGYRVRSAPWFGSDIRGAVVDVMARLPVPAVLLDVRTPIERYWRFYALAAGRAEIVDLPTYYDPQGFDPTAVVDGALLVCVHDDPVCRMLGHLGDWRRLSVRLEPDLTPSFEVFRKGQAEK